jgi:NodT family efflux transporter outer membrane factor (OMF) lipoprotein
MFYCVGRHLVLFASALALLGSFGGCTSLHDYVHNGFKVGPNYYPPEAEVGEHWIEEADKRVRTDSEDLSQWWLVFNDPLLNELIANAREQNLSLQEAALRVLQAQAQLGYARGTPFPQIQSAVASYRHQLTAASKIPGLSDVVPIPEIPQATLDTWYGGFNLAWEVDFWGRFRRAVDAAEAHLEATVYDQEAVSVTIAFNVARRYIAIRSCQTAIAWLEKEKSRQQEIEKEAADKVEIGTEGKDVLGSARSNLVRTEAVILEFQKQLRSQTNGLCVLLGMPPQDLQQRLGIGPIPTAPPEVAVGIPAELLSRRPDVRKVERDAAEQAERIGMAIADFYPAISFTGMLGYQGNELPLVFRSQALSGTVGPALDWKILHYGRLANNVRFQDARFRELLVKYQKTVLVAQREAEDAIYDFLRNGEIVKQRQASVRSLEDALAVAADRWKNLKKPEGDYTPVALYTQNLIAEKVNLATETRNLADALIRIYAALGGGWPFRSDAAETLPDTTPQAPEDMTPRFESDPDRL